MSHSDREPLLPTHVRNAANRAANALPSRDEAQRQRYAERQRQMAIADRRGDIHLGAPRKP